METNKIYNGDALQVLKTFPDNSIDCCISSPPYYALRDYGVEGQLGLEKTFHEYLDKLIEIFREVKRILKPTGTIWVNLGDSYGGSNQGYGANEDSKTGFQKAPINAGFYASSREKCALAKVMPKSLLNIPSRFAIKMTDELNLIQRNEIIWYKRNCMPSSVKDRFTVDFEKIYFFTKSKRYYFEQIYEKSIIEFNPLKKGNRIRNVGGRNDGFTTPNGVNPYLQGRNKRCVWDITTKPYKEAHFATFPEDLVRPMVQAGCPRNGTVLDIFAGSGTTLKVAKEMGRNYIGIELNPEYLKLIEKRLNNIPLKLIG